jgi:hypothetical protein
MDRNNAPGQGYSAFEGLLILDGCAYDFRWHTQLCQDLFSGAWGHPAVLVYLCGPTSVATYLDCFSPGIDKGQKIAIYRYSKAVLSVVILRDGH